MKFEIVMGNWKSARIQGTCIRLELDIQGLFFREEFLSVSIDKVSLELYLSKLSPDTDFKELSRLFRFTMEIYNFRGEEPSHTYACQSSIDTKLFKVIYGLDPLTSAHMGSTSGPVNWWM